MEAKFSGLNSPSNLTNREIEILELLLKGKSNKEIANRLSITIRTVKFHTNNLYSKLSVTSRLEATARVWEQYKDAIGRM